MIESEACTLNGLLALPLALASVISYDCKRCSNLWHHSLTTSEALLTIVILFIIQPTDHRHKIKQTVDALVVHKLTDYYFLPFHKWRLKTSSSLKICTTNNLTCACLHDECV